MERRSSTSSTRAEHGGEDMAHGMATPETLMANHETIPALLERIRLLTLAIANSDELAAFIEHLSMTRTAWTTLAAFSAQAQSVQDDTSAESPKA